MTIPNDPIVGELKLICQQLTPATQLHPTGYRPTYPQIFFFTLFRVDKERKEAGKSKQKRQPQKQPLGRVELQEYGGLVQKHLADQNGENVSQLQCKNRQAWELLAYQLRLGVKHVNTSEELKDEAVSNTLLKLFKILDNMERYCPPPRLEQNVALEELVTELLSEQIAIYDFRAYFYAYGRRAAYHELVSLLRRLTGESHLDEELLVDWQPDKAVINDETLAEWQKRLYELMPKLLEAMEQLTWRQKEVVRYTLAARPQFWQALAMAGVDTPIDFPARDESLGDRKIGELLGIKHNNVAVHRSNVKKHLNTLSPELAVLFEVLIKSKF